MDLKHVPQSNVTGYSFDGLAPEDAPIVSVSRIAYPVSWML
jgi:hypothetical protein